MELEKAKELADTVNAVRELYDIVCTYGISEVKVILTQSLRSGDYNKTVILTKRSRVELEKAVNTILEKLKQEVLDFE